MLNNLPIGVYVAGKSPVHRLRARTKLIALTWLAAVFFAANHKQFHYGVYVISFAVLALALAIARVDIRFIWRRMRWLIFLLAIGIPFSLMFTPGVTWKSIGPLILTFHHVHLALGPLRVARELLRVTIGPVVVTYDGIWFVISFSAIFLLLYLGSMTLTMTTTPVALAEGMVQLLRPLRRLRLPVDEFGLMVLVALRFIPVLIQETEQMVKAQASRGADLTTGSPVARIRGVTLLLVPLVQGALRRAQSLAAALESRGYGVTGEATLLHEGPMRLADWSVLAGVVALTTLAYFFA